MRKVLILAAVVALAIGAILPFSSARAFISDLSVALRYRATLFFAGSDMIEEFAFDDLLEPYGFWFGRSDIREYEITYSDQVPVSVWARAVDLPAETSLTELLSTKPGDSTGFTVVDLDGDPAILDGMQFTYDVTLCGNAYCPFDPQRARMIYAAQTGVFDYCLDAPQQRHYARYGLDFEVSFLMCRDPGDRHKVLAWGVTLAVPQEYRRDRDRESGWYDVAYRMQFPALGLVREGP